MPLCRRAVATRVWNLKHLGYVLFERSTTQRSYLLGDVCECVCSCFNRQADTTAGDVQCYICLSFVSTSRLLFELKNVYWGTRIRFGMEQRDLNRFN